MSAPLAVVLFSVWFVGSRIYGVGGASLDFLLLLAMCALGFQILSNRRRRMVSRRR